MLIAPLATLNNVEIQYIKRTTICASDAAGKSQEYFQAPTPVQRSEFRNPEIRRALIAEHARWWQNRSMNSFHRYFFRIAALCAGAIALSASQPPHEDFVFYIDHLQMDSAEASLEQRTCTTVHPDNTFVFERTLQDIALPEKADFFVYHGKLTDDQAKSLKQILSSKEFDDATQDSPIPNHTAMQEGEMVDAFVTRESGKVAYLQYSVAFGVQGQGRTKPGYYAQTKNALGPLMKFVHDVIEKNKGKSLKGEPAFCSPPAGKERLKKPMVSR
jgi:hypothetical protein